MLIKTHIAIAFFFILMLLPFVNNPMVFGFMVLVSTILPDIDSRFSFIGQKKIARLLQFFTKHRGIIHSFTLLFLLTFFFVLFFPTLSLGFFLGYAIHLFVDSFTKDGIVPYYPMKKKSKGVIISGGKIESGVFAIFIILDLAVLLAQVARFL
ncbi:metal-dependent hydrolase [Candidatus Pacearchaeota archaeon]|nr:metal-dependent hydrolase [Candidatus Pacearchaeota archaeon]